jgi:cysteine desulfurase
MSYLDCNATTDIDPLVLDEMSRYFKGQHNPSSSHALGRAAREVLIQAKDITLQKIGCAKADVVFCSCATEALNTVIYGIKPGSRVISSKLEHSAVFRALQVMEQKSLKVTYVNPVPNKGSVDIEELKTELAKGAELVILSAANHETGVINPYLEVAELCKAYQVPFLLDAVGLVGREAFTFPEGKVGVVLSGHKIHGPQGCGVLVFTKGFPFTPLLYGGKQQGGKRGGTENVASIAGFKKALELLAGPKEFQEMARKRDEFERFLSSLTSVTIIGKNEKRVCNTTKVIFNGIDAEWLFMQLDLNQVYASFGSACASNAREPSYILQAMGLSNEQIASALRFSIGRFTTQEELHRASHVLKRIFKSD